MTRPVFFHVDMDAFYASVEQRDRPELRGRPVIVGAAPGRRGVVSACSYEARRYGVHSAMPVGEAYRRCPGGVYLPVRMERYQEVSRQVMAILRDYTPLLQQISVDEAFLDMTGTERLFGPPRFVAEGIKKRISSELNLVISVGIGPSRFIAKLASDYDKPDGLWEVGPDQAADFVAGLPLSKLWGVGARTLERLEDFGITTVRDIRDLGEQRLVGLLGEASARYLSTVAGGGDPGVYAGEAKSRSMSGERTFEHDVRDAEEIHKRVLELAMVVEYRLIAEKMTGRTVVLKLRNSEFETHTMRRSLDHDVRSAEELYRTGLSLLDRLWNRREAVRLVGLGVSGIRPISEGRQQELFETLDDKRRRVEEAIQSRGMDLTKASLLSPGDRGRADRARDGGGRRPESPKSPPDDA